MGKGQMEGAFVGNAWHNQGRSSPVEYLNWRMGNCWTSGTSNIQFKHSSVPHRNKTRHMFSVPSAERKVGAFSNKGVNIGSQDGSQVSVPFVWRNNERRNSKQTQNPGITLDKLIPNHHLQDNVRQLQQNNNGCKPFSKILQITSCIRRRIYSDWFLIKIMFLEDNEGEFQFQRRIKQKQVPWSSHPSGISYIYRRMISDMAAQEKCISK